MNSETTHRISRDLAVAKHGMVAAKHPWAVRAALDVLRQGGNAVDAAVTAAFSIGVLEPWMSGIGGGGFMTIQMADGRRKVVDYFARAPLAAKPDMYELTGDFGHSVVGFQGVKDQANAYGPRSAAVPGMVAGMAAALEQYGTISLGRAVQPAIGFAEEGLPINWYNGMLLGSQLTTIQRDAETARIFLRHGVTPAPLFGDVVPSIPQSELAQTLRRIADHGPDGFYRGEVAERIAEHMQATGGIITTDDLAKYRATLVDPLVITYRDVELVLLPYQAGGTTIAETFNIVEGCDLRSTGFNTATSLHHIAEASRRAYADRFAYVGDPDFVDIDWSVLASKIYAAGRRAEIEPDRVVPAAPGAGVARGRTTESVPAGDGGCTTHLSVVDAEGNMVSLTQTLTLIFGSAVTVPGTGVLLNDTMNLFDPLPGRNNSIAPFKRPASSMAHVVAVQDGTPILAVGAPGGRRIMDTCMQMALDVIEFGLDIQSACGAPLIDCAGPELLVDDRIPESTRATLQAKGHNVVPVEVSFSPRGFASPTGVTVDSSTGLRYGGADPFGIGIAAGH